MKIGGLMKGLLIISHNMEDVEALGSRALLVRAGFDITMASFDDPKIIQTAFGLNIEVEEDAFNVHVEDYDFLMIPGGKYVGETVDNDKHIKQLATAFKAQNKMIAAICAGPRFLGQAGLLDWVHYTAFPGSEKDIENGFYHPDEKAMTDQDFITARGAGAVYDFVYEIIAYYHDHKAAKALLDQIKY